MITVAYVNFWMGLNAQDWWLSKFIKHNIDTDVKIINYNHNPDILFVSCFGGIDIIKTISAKCKIFFYGENLNGFPPYNNIELLQNTFDIILGFKYNDINNKILRLPLWILYYPFYSFTEESNILKYIQESYNKNINNPEKQLNTSLVSSHDRGGVRTKIFNEMKKYTDVLCPGSFNHNTDNIGPSYDDKINFISKTTYNICPENSEFEGYFTEKIFHALDAGCIPIYWAIDRPEKDILNQDSYCWVNINNSDEMSVNIKDVIENKDKYIKIDNLFTPQAKYIVNDFYENLKFQIKEKLGLTTKQQKYGISYTSRHFINRYIPLSEQGTNCGLFDIFKCWREEDVDENFKQKYLNVWNDSTRGGGWWIWKPYIIYEQLKKINDNDILVYFDGGCSINITPESTKRFQEYINLVNNNWSGILRFELTHPEWKFTNNHTVEYFSNKFNVNMDKHIHSNQILDGIIIMRKNIFTMSYFEKILEILNDDPYLFTEKYTNKNEMHRHDQSVFSLLCKIMPGSVIIPDETYFAQGFNSAFAEKCPIWATRSR